MPAEAAVEAPKWLSEGAREVWDRLAPDLTAKGVLTAWDTPAFAVLVDAVARHQEAAELVARDGVVVRGERGQVKNPAVQIVRDYAGLVASLASRFGLTPSDRQHLNVKLPAGAKRGPERLLS